MEEEVKKKVGSEKTSSTSSRGRRDLFEDEATYFVFRTEIE